MKASSTNNTLTLAQLANLVLLATVLGAGLFLGLFHGTLTGLVTEQPITTVPALRSLTGSGSFAISLQTPTAVFLSGRLLGSGSAQFWLETATGRKTIINVSTAGEILPSPEEPSLARGSSTGDQQINAQLTYQQQTPWDKHDNGIEPSGNVIDVSLDHSTFSWQHDSTKVCTRWKIIAVNNNDEEHTLCSGNDMCCAFVGLANEPGLTWDTLALHDGLYGAKDHTILTAQVIYYDVNLNLSDLRTDVVYADEVSIPLTWVPTEQVHTVDTRCMETCTLQPEDQVTNEGTLFYSISDGAVFELESYGYTTASAANLPPVYQGPTNLTITTTNITFAIDDWFDDPEHATLQLSVEGSINLAAQLEQQLLTITPDPGFVGERSITLFATDGTTTIEQTVEVIITPSPQATKILFKNRQGQTILEKINEQFSKNIALSVEKQRARRATGRGFGVASLEPVSNSLTLTGMDSSVNITGFMDTITPVQPIEEKITTDVIALPSFSFDSATIALQKNGPITAILECPAFDIATGSCPAWKRSTLPFTENDTHVVFTVTHFSGYAGANISIINVQSYPIVGGYWTVYFNTTGTAPLTISAINETTFTEYPTDDPATSDDLTFVQLRCGNTVLNATPVTNSSGQTTITFENYTCGETGAEQSRVLTSGKHHLMFTFGDDVGYANNDATTTTRVTDFSYTGTHVAMATPDNIHIYINHFQSDGGALIQRGILSNSSDGGFTWSNRTLVDYNFGGGYGQFASISAPSTNDIYIAQSKGDSILINYTHDGGITWNGADPLATPFTAIASSAYISGLDSSNVYLAGTNSGNGAVEFYSNAGGGAAGSWIGPTDVEYFVEYEFFSPSGTPTQVSLKAFSTTHIYMTYMNTTNSEIRFANSSNGGIAWTTRTISERGGKPTIAVSPTGTHLFIAASNDSLHFINSSDSGKTWTNRTIVPGPNIGDFPSIDAANNYNISIAFYNITLVSASQLPHIIRTTDGGVTWTSTTIDTPLGSPATGARHIAIKTNGTTDFVAYGNFTNSSLKFTTFTPSTQSGTASINLTVNMSARNTSYIANATYLVRIHNNGTASGSYNLTVTNWSAAQHAFLNQTNITLAAGGVGTILLTVGDARLGSYTTSVNAYFSTDYAINATINQTTNVTDIPVFCPITIAVPGRYVLTQNVSWDDSCIRIQTGNVDVNGHGYTVEFNHSAINITTPTNAITNISIRNMFLWQQGDPSAISSQSAIESWADYLVSNVTVRDIVVQSNNTYGITFALDLKTYANSTITNITAPNMTKIRVQNSTDISIVADTIGALIFSNVNHSRIRSTVANYFIDSSACWGIDLSSSYNNSIVNSSITCNGTSSNIGLRLSSSSLNTVQNSTIVVGGNGTDQTVVSIEGNAQTSSNNSFLGNYFATPSNQSYAIQFTNAHDNTTFIIHRVLVTHNTSNEYRITTSSQQTLLRQESTLQNNASISVQLEGALVIHSILPEQVAVALPSHYTSMGIFFNISNTTGNGGTRAFLNISYAHLNPTNYGLPDATSLALWRYNTTASSWENASFMVDGQSGNDLSSSNIYANLTAYGLFGIFGTNLYSVNITPNVTRTESFINQNATYLLRIGNNGTLPATFNVSVANLHAISVATLNVSNITLGPSTIGTVFLVLNTSTPGSYNVTVSTILSTNRSINATTQELETIFSGIPGINITQNVTAQTKTIYENASYLITIGNNGTATYSYNISLRNIQSAAIATLNQTNITLNAGTTGSVVLYVGNPIAGTFNVTVTAILSTNYSINATTQELESNFTDVPTVNITQNITAQSKSVLANASYLISIGNNGTSTNSYNITLRNIQGAGIAVLNQTNITLNANTVGNVILWIGNPAPGTFNATVTALLSTNTSVNATTQELETTFEHLAAVNITQNSTLQSITTEYNASYLIMVGNNGTTTYSYNLSLLNLQSAATATLNQTNITLSSGTTGNVLLFVGNPTSGIFNVTVTAILSTNNSINATTALISTNITELASINITAPQTTNTSPAGTLVQYILNIHNNGTVSGRYNLSITNSNNAESVSLNQSSLNLTAGSSGTIRASISNSVGGEFNMTVIAVLAINASINATSPVLQTIFLNFSGINISATPASSSIETGQSATYTINIGNNGSMPAAYNLTLNNYQGITTATLNQTNISLNARSRGSVTLTISHAVSGTLAINIRGYDATNNSINATTSVTTTFTEPAAPAQSSSGSSSSSGSLGAPSSSPSPATPTPSSAPAPSPEPPSVLAEAPPEVIEDVQLVEQEILQSLMDDTQQSLEFSGIPVTLESPTQISSSHRSTSDGYSLEVTCMQFKHNKTSTLPVQSFSHDVTQLSLPFGYKMAAPPFKIPGAMDDIEMTLELPQDFKNLRVMRCSADGCNEVREKIMLGDGLICGNTTVYNTTTTIETIKQKAILSTVSSEESYLMHIPAPGKQVTLLNNQLSLQGLRQGADVGLLRQSTAIPPAPTPRMRILGVPIHLVLEHEYYGTLQLSMKIPEIRGIEQDTIMVAAYTDHWRMLPARIANGTAFIEVATSEFANDKTLITLLGSICSDCDTPFKREYAAENARFAVVLVHGLLSDPSTFDPFIEESRLTHQPYAIYTFGYKFNQSLEQAGADLATAIESVQAHYDEIDIIAHSAGGLVSQYALQDLQTMQRAGTGYAAQKVKTLMLAGSPNRGILSETVIGATVNLALQTGLTGKFLAVDNSVLQNIIDPPMIPRTEGVDYVVLVGTKDYGLKIGDQFLPHDGIVSRQSASTVGGIPVDGICNNYFEVNLSHTDLIDDKTAVHIMTRRLFQKHDEITIGRNQYLNIKANDVSPDDTFYVIGKPIREEEAPNPGNCNCGNRVCGVDESTETCPQDCIVWNGVNFCSWLYLICLIMTILSVSLFVAGPLRLRLFHQDLHSTWTTLTRYTITLTFMMGVITLILCGTSIWVMLATILALALVFLAVAATEQYVEHSITGTTQPSRATNLSEPVPVEAFTQTDDSLQSEIAAEVDDVIVEEPEPLPLTRQDWITKSNRRYTDETIDTENTYRYNKYISEIDEQLLELDEKMRKLGIKKRDRFE